MGIVGNGGNMSEVWQIVRCSKNGNVYWTQRSDQWVGRSNFVHWLMKQTSNLYVNSISSDSKSCPKKFHLIAVKRQLMSLSLSLYRKILLNHQLSARKVLDFENFFFQYAILRGAWRLLNNCTQWGKFMTTNLLCNVASISFSNQVTETSSLNKCNCSKRRLLRR